VTGALGRWLVRAAAGGTAAGVPPSSQPSTLLVPSETLLLPGRSEARQGMHGRSSTRRRRADTSRGGSGDGCRRGRGSAPATTRFSAWQGLGWGNEVAWELQRSGSEALVREVGDGDCWKGSSASASMASGGGGHEGMDELGGGHTLLFQIHAGQAMWRATSANVVYLYAISTVAW
jgi:hypothetical protein